MSLADNGLTNISVASLAPLANTLQSLDLSANLFTEIPDSLATLTSLRALNLSNCMIQSLHSLGRNPLPAITTLNLRSNRLASLAGVERLLSLERVDFRDNKLTDPTEIARLTGVPEIQEIYVHRNPFCKTYGGYRVTIFNLFRKTPGYTEDVVIDSTGPSHSEKKQLVERVPEAPGVPVMKPPPEDDMPPPSLFPPLSTPPNDGMLYRSEEMGTPTRRTNSHHQSRSVHGGSHRRKKAPKRRIVELSQSQAGHQSNELPAIAAPIAPTPQIEEPVNAEDVPVGDPAKRPAPSPQHSPVASSPEIRQAKLLPLDTAVKQSEADSHTSPPAFDMSSDLYKKKIEALRHDFGNTWLSALGDESWETQPDTTFPEREFSTSIRPNGGRNPSQGIVSGGRTLG